MQLKQRDYFWLRNLSETKSDSRGKTSDGCIPNLISMLLLIPTKSIPDSDTKLPLGTLALFVELMC